MSTITKEQAKDLRNAFDCWQQDYDPVEDKEQYDMFGLGIVAMDALLASLEAEAVSKSVFNINHESSLIKHVKKVVRDTSSPPAPVSVPDEATPENIEILASTFAPRGVTYQWDRDECNAAADSWNACRAVMLQGADGKPELTVWYGDMPETNGKTNWTAILHRKGECLSTGITIDRSEYPARVRYEADRLRYLIGESDKRPCIIDYDANAHSGYVEPVTTAYKLNSPVIPDGSEDTKRLDWLDAQNKRLNEYYGTSYGWKFDANFQRNAMMLNDSNYPVMTVRQAIDEAIAAAPQQVV